MKVALVHRSLGLTGGTERYGIDLARALLGMGDEVHLVVHEIESPGGVAEPVPSDLRRDGREVCEASGGNGREHREASGGDGREAALPTGASASPLRTTLEGAMVHRVPMARAGRTAKMLSFAWQSRRLIRDLEAKTGPFDVVLGLGRTLEQDVLRVGGGCHAAYLEAVEGWRNGRPPSPVAPAVYHRIALQIEARQMALTRTRRVIAVSHRVKDELIRWYGTPGEAITPVHNGVDLERFDPTRFSREEARAELALPRNGLVALFVGNGLERKGFFPLVEAFGRMAAEARARGITAPLRLLVAGRDALRHRLALNRLTSGWNSLDARLELVGAQGRIERCYAAADLLALPTRYEPFGNVCLEAMAMGLPVITTTVNGAAELLEGESRALVLPETDRIGSRVEAISGALVALLEEGRRRGLGQGNRAVAMRHSVVENARAVREVLVEAAGDRVSGPQVTR